MQELFSGTNALGFLGVSVYALAPALLAALTAFILTARCRHTPTVVLGCVAAALLVLLFANSLYVNSRFVNDLFYDENTAAEFSEGALEANPENGYEQYRPHTGTAIARLDELSSLAFSPEEGLPKVDCATALLPFASSLVTATYPQNATTVGWDVGSYQDGFVNGFCEGYTDGFTTRANGYGANEESTKSATIAGDQLFAAEGAHAGRAEGYRQGFADATLGKEAVFDHSDLEQRARATLANSGTDKEAVFQYNNSSSGFAKLADGRTDVFFGTKADEGQASYARGLGVEFSYAPIGREGLVFLVNASNPVESLTVDQVKGIYSGTITNWKEVGSRDEPIVAYQRNKDSGSQSMMVRFMGDTPLAPEDAPPT